MGGCSFGSWIVAVRVFLVVFSFLLTWWFEDQSSKLHFGNRVRRLSMMLNEIIAELRLFFYYHPLEALLNSHDSDFPPNENQAFPILFVHGFYNNAGFWMKHKSYFRKNGLAGLYSLNLDPPVQDIECFADQLAQRIQQVCRHSGRAKVILIAHSMGGLVCRACIARSGADNIERLITIGTPHHGTVMAKTIAREELKANATRQSLAKSAE